MSSGKPLILQVCSCLMALAGLLVLQRSREWGAGGKSLYSHPAGRVGRIPGCIPELGDRKEKNVRV